MSEHTPTPWATMGDRGDIISVCKGVPQRLVAKASGQPTSDERAANAAFIVKAVNAHAQLVEALQPFATAIVTPSGEIVGLAWEHINAARAALASLKETAS